MSSATTSPASAVEIDPQTAAVELEQRRGRLVLWTLAASTGSLFVAAKFGSISWSPSIDLWPAVLLSLAFGTFIGLAQAPIVARCIAGKRFSIVLPAVYVGGAVAAIAAMQSGELIWGLVALTVVPPLLALAATLLPNVALGRRDRCFNCGYNIGGFASDVCPECGAPLPAPVAPPVPTRALPPQEGQA